MMNAAKLGVRHHIDSSIIEDHDIGRFFYKIEETGGATNLATPFERH